MSGTKLERIATKISLVPASYPLAIHYRAWPTEVYNGMVGLVSQESDFDSDILNYMYDKYHTAEGTYQITNSSSTIGKIWKGLRPIISIPLQTFDVTRLHWRKSGGGGVEHLIANHAGTTWIKEHPDYVSTVLKKHGTLPKGSLEVLAVGAVVGLVVLL